MNSDSILTSSRKSSLPIFGALILWVGMALLVGLDMAKRPYIGAQFQADIAGQSITVVKVTPKSPAHKAGLSKGDSIIAVVDPKGIHYRLTGFEATIGRHQFDDYEMQNAAKAAKYAIWPFLTNKSIVMQSSDGRAFHIEPTVGQPLTSLPLRTFFTGFQGLLVLLVTVAIWAHATKSAVVNLLLLSGFGLVVNVTCGAFLGSSELAFAPQFFIPAVIGSSFAIMLFSFGLMALLCYFPSPILPLSFAWMALGVGVLIQFGITFQVIEFPFHTFQFSNLIPFPIAALASILQWRRSKSKPVERASVMWFSLTIFGIVSMVVMLYSVPLILHIKPIMSPHIANFSLAFIFFGIALGALKYRLFDMQRIWWRTIVWLVGGFVVVITDILLVWQFRIDEKIALPLALILAGWVYFPLRQLMLDYFYGSQDINISDHINDMIASFSRLRNEDEFDGRFMAFLKKIYGAAEVGKVTREVATVATLEDNGQTLRVPNVSGRASFTLLGKANGRQLFSLDDINTAQIFRQLVVNIKAVKKIETGKLQQERDRIVRDLHDDVGGRLLSLVYQASDATLAADARATLTALKDTLVLVEGTQSVDFDVAWNQIKSDAIQRMERSGRRYEFHQEIMSPRILSAQEYISLKRILAEIVSNALKYGSDDVVQFSARVTETGTVIVASSNTIAVSAQDENASNRGLLNIKSRLAEIGGQLTVKPDQVVAQKHRFSLSLNIPMSV